MINDFVWPSDRARAESPELNRACEMLERLFDYCDDIEQEDIDYMDANECGAGMLLAMKDREIAELLEKVEDLEGEIAARGEHEA